MYQYAYVRGRGHWAAGSRQVQRWGARALGLVVLWLTLSPLASAADTPAPPSHTTLWEAPQGINASAAATRWLADLEQELAAARARCPDARMPSLNPSTPSRAFRLPTSPTHPVIYTKDAIVNRLLVIAWDDRGCPWSASVGRAQPFHERWFLSPLANVRLPAGAPAQEATVVIQDARSIRPWLRVDTVDDFVRNSAGLWLLLGAYAGVLIVLLLVGLGLRRSHPSPVANAYCVYIVAQIFYQFQVLGIGPAWVPGWPQGENFAVMQGVALAALAAGLGLAIITFLRPSGMLRLIIVCGVTLAAAAFLASVWQPAFYRIGALSLLLLAPAVLFALVHGLRRNEPWVRWFAVGLSATMIGGGAQAATVVFDGAGLGALGNFAFPLGNLVESVCWLVSLLVRLRAERTAAAARLLHDATHNALTGLPNRLYLTAGKQSSLAAAAPAGGVYPADCHALVLINLDRFKVINDSLGYAAGDDLLVAVARLLRAIAPPGATVAHLDADAFAILLPCDVADAPGVATQIIERLREPIALTGGSVHVRASIGVVCAPEPDAAVIDILRDADSALNLAKGGGGNRSVTFEPVMRVPAFKRFRLEQDMVEALRGDQFEVFFQPIVALADRRAVGMEALVRWHQPQQGLVSPADFIPLAEETGLIIPLGTWVLEHTIAQIEQWKEQGVWRPGFYVSVNLSGHQLLDGTLLARIDSLIERSGLTPGELRLELTETAIITNIDAASAVLPALRERHIPLYMDDFGTGYSSLSYLNELPFDVLKIDQSFVTGIEAREQSQILVRTVLALAQAMGLSVVAEGVETEGQAALLHAMGCPYGQGYLFSRPVPAQQACAWLQ
ncbi:bifunctional diguanylate cyclase/phosphodiesterase [uncultured Thiodictyon sp.]|uniref:putative bifunctional diguanylate cyclase/phosphodiesterase n=1 Tax=uncultured Thiodictyon sp. TaxID=1846217 RepID=UPI002600B0CA|nr:bifunctional diguanylate cyclase/phosphodiesterase [uncultured Thiodictyon sp.]